MNNYLVKPAPNGWKESLDFVFKLEKINYQFYHGIVAKFTIFQIGPTKI